MENLSTGMKGEFRFATKFRAGDIAYAAFGKATNIPADHQ
jgi:hypothetical protein